MNTNLTPAEVRNTYKLHHTAWARGYVSRSLTEGVVESYDGRFGKGYVICMPSHSSSQYYVREYYVNKKEA